VVAHPLIGRWITPAGVRWRQWEGEVVAYHPGSGDTHLLSPIAGAVLEAVAGGAHDEVAIVAAVAARLDLNDNDGLAAMVEEAIATLARLGLLEPVAP